MPKKPTSLIGRILVFKAKYLSQQQFILILSVLLGFVTGLVSVVMKNCTHYIQKLVQSGYFIKYYNPYYFLFPIAGIAITILIKKYVIRDHIGEGVPSTLFAISRKNGFIKSNRMYASVITSIFTVGFGGSVGLEGPAVGTGAAVGANFGRWAHLNYKARLLLISCAASGAISAIFNAPITGILFTIEIFSLDLTFSSLIPLLLASASGAVTSIFLQGNDHLFHYKYIAPFQVADVPFYLLLGVCCAFISLYFRKVFLFITPRIERIKNKTNRVLFGGSILGALIFLIPPLYGEGYDTINDLLNGNIHAVVDESLFYNHIQASWMILALLLGLVFFKAFATSLTLSAGGVGGVFAPALFIGASLGYVFSAIVNETTLVTISPSNFTLVGMAGVMAGVLHAPLTAIFLIAEITGGYQLFIPLMLVSAISFLVTRGIKPHSIYTDQLAKKGDLLTHNKDQVILTLLNIESVIEKNFIAVRPEMTLGELVKVVSKSSRNIFPVTDKENKLVGVLTLDDFRNIMFDQSIYETTFVSELMNQPPALVDKSESMDKVIKKFQESGAWNLPVVDREKYVGFISKSKLFSVYRKMLLDFSD